MQVMREPLQLFVEGARVARSSIRIADDDHQWRQLDIEISNEMLFI